MTNHETALRRLRVAIDDVLDFLEPSHRFPHDGGDCGVTQYCRGGCLSAQAKEHATDLRTALAALLAAPPAPQERPEDFAWALERVTRMAACFLINAEKFGPKLLKGHGYPDEVMRDAQDYRALKIVLDAVASPPVERPRQEEKAESLPGSLASGDPIAPPSTPNDREQCICAAIKLTNGEVWRGHRHDGAIKYAMDAGVTKQEIYDAEQGFITSRNRFVGREEGARLQHDAGIVSAETGNLPEREGGMLFSEDLYLRAWREPSASQGGTA